jgi:hypothetical protein
MDERISGRDDNIVEIKDPYSEKHERGVDEGDYDGADSFHHS